MSRTIAAGMLAEILAAKKRPILFAFFDFSSGPVRVWNGLGDRTWGGYTWSGLGDLGSVGAIEETTEVKAAGTFFTLNGVDPTLLSTVLAESYNGRAVTLWLGALNSSGTVAADPVKVFSGRMDGRKVRIGPDMGSITISAESRLIDLNGADTRRFNHEDQLIDFPVDLAFNLLAGNIGKVLLWGAGPGGKAAQAQQRAVA